MIYLLAALISLGFFLLARADAGASLSPDGRFYLSMGKGDPVPRPYSLRWLWPFLLGASPRAWEIVSGLALVAWGPAFLFFLGAWGFSPADGLKGVALLCGLPALFRLNSRFPILVDAPAFLLALASAGAALSGRPASAAALALLAGASKESAPIFAAAFSLSPWPLLGLLAVGWWRRPGPIPGWASEWLSSPVRAARKVALGSILDWKVMLLPWGLLAPLAVFAPWEGRAAWAAGLSLALGYSSLALAQDRARLFSWAAPALIVVALPALPPSWAAAALLAHAFNPYRGV